MENTTLLLVGRIGNGKSATGNSILGRKAFTSRSHRVEGPIEILKETSDRNRKAVTVVDGLDIDDIDQNSKRLLAEGARKALEICHGSVTAVILVLKYGIRFTKQEKDAVDLIRAIFRPNVLKSNGVIVMTHGDNFYLDTEDDERRFQYWCKAQTGHVKTLFEECESRIVLFNNKAVVGSHEEQQQYQQLMEKVDEIEQPYTSPIEQVSALQQNWPLEDLVRIISQYVVIIFWRWPLSQLRSVWNWAFQ